MIMVATPTNLYSGFQTVFHYVLCTHPAAISLHPCNNCLFTICSVFVFPSEVMFYVHVISDVDQPRYCGSLLSNIKNVSQPVLPHCV